MLKMSLSFTELKKYTRAQLSTFFPDGGADLDGAEVDVTIAEALRRLEYSFSHIAVSYYWDDGQPYFYHLNSDQYAQYLWFLANTLWRNTGNRDLCSKLILLNKTLHGFWISYTCHMPEIFIFSHPVGSVIGNSYYSDFLLIAQNVTINTSTAKGQTPLYIGKGCYFSAGSKIIGGGTIGKRCSLGVSSLLYNQEMPDDTVAVIENGATEIRRRKSAECFAQRFIRDNLSLL